MTDSRSEALALVPEPPVLDTILADLLATLPHVALSTPADRHAHWVQVGYWLLQLELQDERGCDRWKVKFLIQSGHRGYLVAQTADDIQGAMFHAAAELMEG